MCIAIQHSCFTSSQTKSHILNSTFLPLHATFVYFTATLMLGVCDYGAEAISYPECSGFLVNGWAPEETMENSKKFKFFDWLLCFSSVTAWIVLPQKSCGTKIPVPQSLSWRPTAGQRAWGLWVRDWCRGRYACSAMQHSCLDIELHAWVSRPWDGKPLCKIWPSLVPSVFSVISTRWRMAPFRRTYIIKKKERKENERTENERKFFFRVCLCHFLDNTSFSFIHQA